MLHWQILDQVSHLKRHLIYWQRCSVTSSSYFRISFSFGRLGADQDYVLFSKHRKQDNSHTAKHHAWRDLITLTVCPLVIVCEIILVVIYIWFTTNAQKMFASFIFHILNGHTTQALMFWIYLIMQVSAMAFIISYILLCFLVSVDITFLFRALREEMDGIFSVLVVDETALERCLHTFRAICELVDAANGTFGVPLALYLIWVVLSIINKEIENRPDHSPVDIILCNYDYCRNFGAAISYDCSGKSTSITRENVIHIDDNLKHMDNHSW